MLIFPYTHFITPYEKWLGSKQSKQTPWRKYILIILCSDHLFWLLLRCRSFQRCKCNSLWAVNTCPSKRHGFWQIFTEQILRNSRVKPFAARSKTIPRPLVNSYFKETMQNLNFPCLVMCLDPNKWERDTLGAKYHQTGQAYTSLNLVWKSRETNSKLMRGSNISNDASHGILLTECRSFLYLDLMASLKTSVWFKWQTCLNRAMVLRNSICQGESRLWQRKDFPHSGAKIHLVDFDKLTLWSFCFFTPACSKASLSHDISDVLAKMWQKQSAQLCFKTVLTKNVKRSKARFPSYSLHIMFNWQLFWKNCLQGLVRLSSVQCARVVFWLRYFAKQSETREFPANPPKQYLRVIACLKTSNILSASEYSRLDERKTISHQNHHMFWQDRFSWLLSTKSPLATPDCCKSHILV